MALKHGHNLVYCFFFLFLPSLFLPFNSAQAGGVLPDTGQTKCYNNDSEIPCPAQGQPFYGQDGNYQGHQPAYRVSANGLVVTDLNTGLMWQQADDGVERNWAAAVSYCEGLVLSGYSDWRLPSCAELVSIVDYTRQGPAINPAFQCRKGWGNSFYWTSTKDPWAPEHDGYSVEFYYGEEPVESLSQTYYVRCLRGRQ
jgi:hypothetical protein